jgi:hypothetical protein
MSGGIQGSIWVYSEGRLHAPVENPVDLKIKSLAHLKDGWRYGEGGPVLQQTIETALEWRRFLTQIGAAKIEAVPGAGREIVVAAEIAGRYTETVIEPDGTFTLVREQEGQEDVYKSDLSVTEAKNFVLGVLGKAWTTFDGSIKMNFSMNMAGFLAQYSRIPEGRISQEVSHLLITNALSLVACPFAITQEGTTGRPTPLVSPQSSGDLKQTYYPAIHG